MVFRNMHSNFARNEVQENGKLLCAHILIMPGSIDIFTLYLIFSSELTILRFQGYLHTKRYIHIHENCSNHFYHPATLGTIFWLQPITHSDKSMNMYLD